MLVYDGSATLTLYVDGAATTSMPASGTITNAAPNLRVGKDTNNNGLATTVDEVAVYNVALTAGQITNHYSVGKGTTGANSAPVLLSATPVTASHPEPIHYGAMANGGGVWPAPSRAARWRRDQPVVGRSG